MKQFHLESADGFSPEVGRFVAMFSDTRSRLMRDLEDLKPGEIDVVPAWGHNAIGTLLYHLAAIELDWTFADLLESGEEDFPEGTAEWFPVDVRERDGRLSPVVEPLERHFERLAWVRDHLLGVLRGMTDADLDRTFDNDGDESGGAWILHHLLQHEAEHRGQIGEIKASMRT